MIGLRAWARDELPLVLELTALTGFVIARPVLASFGEAPDVLIAEAARPVDIAVFALAVVLAPVGLALLVGTLIRAIRPRLRTPAHWLAVAGLGALAVWQLADMATPLPLAGLAATGLVGGALAALARFKVPGRVCRPSSPTGWGCGAATWSAADHPASRPGPRTGWPRCSPGSTIRTSRRRTVRACSSSTRCCRASVGSTCPAAPATAVATCLPASSPATSGPSGARWSGASATSSRPRVALDAAEGLRRVLDADPVPGEGPLAAWQLVAGTDLVGRSLDEVSVDGDERGAVSAQLHGRYDDLDLDAQLPLEIDVTSEVAAGSPLVAAVNGVISGSTVAEPKSDGRSYVQMILRPDAFTPGDNDVRVFVVDGPSGDEVLREV
jgi:hypothetical protein